MSRFMSRFVIFSNSKKSNISNPTIFPGGQTLGGGVEPGRADGAWPSLRPCQRVIFSKKKGPSPTRSVRLQSQATSARPRQRVSNLTGRLPGLAREILTIFSLFLRAVSPPPRGFEAATYSLARAPRLLSGVARSLQSAYEAVCHAPIPAFRYRWFGVGYVVP